MQYSQGSHVGGTAQSEDSTGGAEGGASLDDGHPDHTLARDDTTLYGSRNTVRPSPSSGCVSLFAEPLPVSDVNVSPSAASTSSPSRPLAALTSVSSGISKPARRMDEARYPTPLATHRLPKVEKDVDDPTTPLDGRSQSASDARDFATVTTLSKLFAMRTSASPAGSRAASYNLGGSAMARALEMGTTGLSDHLYARGLVEGRHSDITVVAFGTRYALHRLILDRAPFFASALSGPWLESQSREVVLHPEGVDPNITKPAFELALKRLYGGDIAEQEDVEAIGLFATGCWLEMQDVVETSIDAMLRQMSPETLSPLIRLVTANYYGRAGERILASAKAMLCRDGWEMPIRCWDGIPGDIIREMVGGDGFFIDSEFERWVLAKRILDRRLKHRAVEAGLVEPGTRAPIRAPESLNLMAVRFDSVYRKTSVTTGREAPASHHLWLSLYTHPDIEPLLVLLDEGIHYVHLGFEQLQYIRRARDALGLPLMPEKVITNALWMSMELRQKVANARDTDLELGLSHLAEERSESQASPVPTTAHDHAPAASAKGKERQRQETVEHEKEGMESGSWDGNGQPRKFWIPSTDCNIVIGGSAEPVVTTSSSFQRHAARLSATLSPEDAQWATDFATSNANFWDGAPSRGMAGQPGVGASSAAPTRQPKPVSYTHFPPFRFAAEFPNPRLLKEKKRVYSRTVFYAGSLWNIYIQKVRSAKNPQLGVYLHRAKERDAEEIIAGSGGRGLVAGGVVGTVDERISILERAERGGDDDIYPLLGRPARGVDHRESRRRARRSNVSQGGMGVEDDTSGSGGDPEGTSTSDPLLARGLGSPTGSANSRSSFTNVVGNDELGPRSTTLFSGDESATDSDSEASLTVQDRRRSTTQIPSSLRDIHTPALPAYVDGRPTIKTYFKIYSPSRGGRLLGVYESAPDRFNFSQSWGWKSSTLMLDEGFFGAGTTNAEAGDANGEETKDGKHAGLGKSGRRGARGEGMLRFMVVIGNL